MTDIGTILSVVFFLGLVAGGIATCGVVLFTNCLERNKP